MGKCSKCGKMVYDTCLSYCPNCGGLLLGRKQKSAIFLSVYQRYKSDVKVGPPAGMMECDKKQYEDALDFYNSHLTTGYAPKGMVIVDPEEYYNKLVVNELEFSQKKKKYGTQNIYRVSAPFRAEIPKYGDRQITKERKVGVSFDGYWQTLYSRQNKWIRAIIQIVYWLLIISCGIVLFGSLVGPFTWIKTLWIAILIIGAVITVWICDSIFEYD